MDHGEGIQTATDAASESESETERWIMVRGFKQLPTDAASESESETDHGEGIQTATVLLQSLSLRYGSWRGDSNSHRRCFRV